MDAIELHNEVANLVGSRLSFKRIAATSIIFYFGGEPGDSTVQSFWLEPPWRYECGGRVVVGSRDLNLDDTDFVSKDEKNNEWNRRCCLVDGVENHMLESITLDPISHDIALIFSEGHIVRQFSSSALNETGWTYRNRSKQITIDVSSATIELRTEG